MEVLVHLTLLFLLIMESCALTCRSDRDSKDEEIKKVFNNCLKQQEHKKSENRQPSENDWKSRGENQRNQWEKDSRSDNREYNTMGNSDVGKKDRNRNKEHGDGINGERQNSRNENLGMDGRRNTYGNRDNRMGNMNGMGRDTSESRNSYGTAEHLRGQDEFLESEEYHDISHQNNYYPNVKSARRYKREKRLELSTGQRSQFNPYWQNTKQYQENNHTNARKNSSENFSKEIDKACVLHCFMENLHMTDDVGMPDRYLVTHALTKDEKNEDLRDFLQESIEECFQILVNENTEDKCEFAKNLLTCLSEKVRSNCDDWNGKPNFLF